MFEFVVKYFGSYLRGLGVALGITVVSMAISVVVGTAGALGRGSGKKVVRALAGVYVGIFRGIPPLVMLYLLYFGIPSVVIGIAVVEDLFAPLSNRILTAMLALGILSGAYSTEIIRAALDAIPGEQMEASRSIGMSRTVALRRVIFPQAARIAFAPLGNEAITLLKATSLASVIGVIEILRAAQIAAGATFQNLLAYAYAGAFYIVVVAVLQIGVTRLEDRARPWGRRVEASMAE